MALRRSAGLLFLWGAITSATANAPGEYVCYARGSDGHCDVCTEAGESCNEIASLPRTSQLGGAANPNWGYYDIFACEEGSSAPGCEIPSNKEQGNGMFVSMGDESSLSGPRDVNVYVQSVFLYLVFGILAVIFVVVLGLCIAFCRYCTCCCCRNSCHAMRCGESHTTPVGGVVCRYCCGGYRRRKVKVAGEEDKTIFEYGPLERAKAYLLMLIFIGMSLGCMAITMQSGTTGIPEAIKGLWAAPDGVVPVVQGSITPVENLVMNIASDTVPTFLRSLNTTLQNGVDLGRLHTDATCILNTMDQLPNVTRILSFLDGMNASLETVSAHVGSIGTEMGVLNSQKDAVVAEADALSGHFVDLNTSIAATTNSLADLQVTVGQIAALKAQLLDPQSGVIGVVNSDVTAMSSATPTETQATDATASLTALTATHSLDPTARAALLSNLQAVRGKVLLMPNTAVTAVALQQFNEKVEQAVNDDLCGDALAAIVAANASLNAIPPISVVNTSINALLGAVSSVSLDGIIAELTSMNRTLKEDLPDFETLRTEVRAVRNARPIVPCVASICEQADSVNATLVVISDANMADIKDLPNSINSTLEDAVNASVDALELVDDAESEIRNVSMGSYINDTKAMQVELDEATADLNVTDMQAELANVDADRTVDFSASSDIVALNDTLRNATIANSTIQGLMALRDATVMLTTSLNQTVVDFTDHYVSTGNPVCLHANGSSTGASCSSYQDSECLGTGERCSVDDTRATFLGVMIGGFRANVPDMGSVNESMSGTGGDAGSVDTASLTTSIADARSSLDSVGVDSFVTELDSVKESLNTFNTSSVNGTLEDVRAAIDDVDFSSLRSNMEDVRESVDEMHDTYKPQLEDYLKELDALRTLLDVKLHGYLSRLSQTALNEARVGGGLKGLLLTVAGVADDATAYVANHSTSVTVEATNYTQDVEDAVGGSLDVIQGQSYAKAGSVYFLTMLATNQDTDTFVEHTDPEAKTMTKNADGSAYSGGRTCLTKACFDATVDEEEGRYPSPALGLVALMAVLTLFALLAMLVPCISSICCAPGRQKYFTSFFTCTTFCCAALFFLVVTVPFVLVMVLGDGCASIETVGMQLLQRRGGDLCTSLGGEGIPRECTWQVWLGRDAPRSLTLDIESLYVSIVEGGGCRSSQNPWLAFVKDAQFAVAGLQEELVESYVLVNGSRNTEGLELMPLVQDIPLTAGRSADRVVHDFVGGVGGVFGCDGMHGILAGVKDNVCCTFVNTLYKLVSALYLFAFATCICGIPAGLCGRKRFVSGPFGRLYQADQKEATRQPERSLELPVVPALSAGNMGAAGPITVDPFALVAALPPTATGSLPPLGQVPLAGTRPPAYVGTPQGTYALVTPGVVAPHGSVGARGHPYPVYVAAPGSYSSAAPPLPFNPSTRRLPIQKTEIRLKPARGKSRKRVKRRGK